MARSHPPMTMRSPIRLGSLKTMAPQSNTLTEMPRPDTYLPGRRAGNRPQRYTSGTEYCPFWVDVMPNLPSSAIFRRLSIRSWPLCYRKG